jgi:glycosyltransferase involved in cell wall biosynthesis
LALQAAFNNQLWPRLLDKRCRLAGASCSEVNQGFPDLRLDIYGDGPYKPKLDQLIRNLGLAENIKTHGATPRKELWGRIAESQIVVQPSLHEAQSISMLEAMALRKPLIAFDYPFSQEVIRNMHNGLLAQPKNVEDLAGKIRLLLSEQELCFKMGENGRSYVEEKHNWEALADQYIRMYKDIQSASSQLR